MTATKSAKTTLEKMPKAYRAALKKVHDDLWDRGPQEGYIVFDSQWMQNPKVPNQFVAPITARNVDASRVGLVVVQVTKDALFIQIMGCEDVWNTMIYLTRENAR